MALGSGSGVVSEAVKIGPDQPELAPVSGDRGRDLGADVVVGMVWKEKKSLLGWTLRKPCG